MAIVNEMRQHSSMKKDNRSRSKSRFSPNNSHLKELDDSGDLEVELSHKMIVQLRLTMKLHSHQLEGLLKTLKRL